jgi:hypothetical protein
MYLAFPASSVADPVGFGHSVAVSLVEAGMLDFLMISVVAIYMIILLFGTAAAVEIFVEAWPTRKPALPKRVYNQTLLGTRAPQGAGKSHSWNG